MNLFGAPTGGPACRRCRRAASPATPDEIAVSSTLGRKIGDQMYIASHNLQVVGIVNNSTVLAQQPNLFLTTVGAQRPGVRRSARHRVGGYPRQSGQGARRLPALVDCRGAIDDMMRPLKVAVDAISIMAVLLWVV